MVEPFRRRPWNAMRRDASVAAHVDA